MVKKRKTTDTDEIWPHTEDGPQKPWNQREISPHENRSKGARMPTISEVAQSPEPAKLAAEIDKHTVKHEFNNSRNKDKGFGGLTRFH